ncbi:hypothetical protein ACVDFE_27680 [Lentzea chajnantorensis]
MTRAAVLSAWAMQLGPLAEVVDHRDQLVERRDVVLDADRCGDVEVEAFHGHRDVREHLRGVDDEPVAEVGARPVVVRIQ